MGQAPGETELTPYQRFVPQTSPFAFLDEPTVDGKYIYAVASVRQEILQNPTSFGDYALPVVVKQNGKQVGYRLQPQQKGAELMQQAGLEADDIITEINGIKLDNPQNGIGALRQLIKDGRIHPGRIEDVVNKAQAEIDVVIREAGESAAYDAGVPGLPAEILTLLGRLKYRTSFGQSVLNHCKETSMLAGVIAEELGADVQAAKLGGLLHDVGLTRILLREAVRPITRYVDTCIDGGTPLLRTPGVVSSTSPGPPRSLMASMPCSWSTRRSPPRC